MMPIETSSRSAWTMLSAVALVVGALGAAPPALAQEYSLFDKFSIGIGMSSLSLDTRVRVDAEAIGGSDIDFEETLGLDSNEFTPSVYFTYRAKQRHLLSLRWDSTGRDATEAVSTQLQFGDLTIPVDATVMTYFDVDEYLIGYTYYPWLRDRWALGLGLGLRWLDITTGVEITALGGGGPIAGARSDTATVSAPLPFLNLDYRYGISPNWRLNAALGLLDIEFDDFKGAQTVLGGTVEHLAWEGFSWGFLASASTVDVDVASSDWAGSLKFDIYRVGIFGKARW